MARRLEKSLAIELRKKGKTYNEIIETLKVPKGTLSGWLSDYPLTSRQIEVLSRNIKRRRIISTEKTIAIKYGKKQARLKKIYEDQVKELLPLTKREFYLAGLLLYWGEGTKMSTGSVSLNNTDPDVVCFFYNWLIKSLGVEKEKIHVLVHLYKDMNIEESLNYWSLLLGVPRGQFIRPYIKESYRRNLTQKGFGHGTCCLYVCNRRLKEKIMAGINAIGDCFSSKKEGLLV